MENKKKSQKDSLQQLCQPYLASIKKMGIREK